MEKRYTLLSEIGVRDIAAYNRAVDRWLSKRSAVAGESEDWPGLELLARVWC